MSLTNNISSHEYSTQNHEDNAPSALYPTGDGTQSIANDAAVQQLARQFTNTSFGGGHANTSHSPESSFDPEKNSDDANKSFSSSDTSLSFNPFLDSSNPSLNPYSDEFSAREWSKHMLRMCENDQERYPGFSAGISFKNLGAYGHSEGVSYQKTVANILLDVSKIFAKFKRTSYPQTTILKDFNGLVKSGETCVVLGRPGA